MRGWRNYIAFVVAGLKLVIMSGAKSLATCFSCYPSCNFSRGMMAIQNSHRATLVTSTNQLLSLPHEILLGWFYFTSLAAQNRMSPYNTDKAHKISQISVALFAIPPSSGWSITALVTWLLEFVISLLRLFVPCCSQGTRYEVARCGILQVPKYLSHENRLRYFAPGVMRKLLACGLGHELLCHPRSQTSWRSPSRSLSQ